MSILALGRKQKKKEKRRKFWIKNRHFEPSNKEERERERERELPCPP